MQSKRFTLLLLIGIGLLLSVVAAINRIVDPFWYYRDFEIDEVNKFKTEMRHFERHVKPMIVARERPDALILGSSFAEIGLDPTHPGFTDQGKLVGYNFGIAGAEWERVLCYFDYAVNTIEVKRIIIGVWPGAMPRVDCKGGLPEVDEFSESKLLLSMKAISASIDTIKKQRQNKPSYTRQGMYYYFRGLPGVEAQFHQILGDRLKKSRCDLTDFQSMAPALVKLDKDLPVADSTIDLEGLRHIIRTAKQKGIELTLFVYPKHALWLELEAVCGTYKAYWSALDEIASLVEQEDGKTELWEFTRYNDVTAEPITRASPVFWQDPGHFNYEFGNLILDAIYNRHNRGDLGGRITTENMADAYQDYLTSRGAYLNTHPDILTSFRQLTK